MGRNACCASNNLFEGLYFKFESNISICIYENVGFYDEVIV